jgi:hypothetical protein
MNWPSSHPKLNSSHALKSLIVTDMRVYKLGDLRLSDDFFVMRLEQAPVETWAIARLRDHFDMFSSSALATYSMKSDFICDTHELIAYINTHHQQTWFDSTILLTQTCYLMMWHECRRH